MTGENTASTLDTFLNAVAGGIEKIGAAVHTAQGVEADARATTVFTPRTANTVTDSTIGLGLLVLLLLVFAFVEIEG